MSERETKDLMSVDSFSQLPFIRAKPPAAASAIRLFGFDFSHEPENHPCEAESSKDLNTSTSVNSTGTAGGGDGSGRKFECHYCCRNFPTSQALGGHQNAHKRERQHAKRAHLQSAMAVQHSAASRFAFEAPLPSPYPSWSTTGPRFYGGLGSVSQPINGSPLQGFWRIPTATMHGSASIGYAHRNHSSAAAPWLGEHEPRVMGLRGVIGVGSVVAAPSASPHGQRACEPMPGTKDGVSLDLHL